MGEPTEEQIERAAEAILAEALMSNNHSVQNDARMEANRLYARRYARAALTAFLKDHPLETEQ